MNKNDWLEKNLFITNINDWNHLNNWVFEHPHGLTESFLFHKEYSETYTFREQHPNKEGITIKFHKLPYGQFHRLKNK